jgi:hypothetical protein
MGSPSPSSRKAISTDPCWKRGMHYNRQKGAGRYALRTGGAKCRPRMARP